jgi:structure-specific recognition protein 1
MKDHFDVVVENREHSLKGWNWGKAKFEGKELVFQVGARPGFEVPLSRVSNTNLVGKTEVAVEFALPKEGEEKGWEGPDELVEMRFYVPGMKEKEGDTSDVDNDASDAEAEETSAAAVNPPPSETNNRTFTKRSKIKRPSARLQENLSSHSTINSSQPHEDVTTSTCLPPSSVSAEKHTTTK